MTVCRHGRNTGREEPGLVQTPTGLGRRFGREAVKSGRDVGMRAEPAGI